VAANNSFRERRFWPTSCLATNEALADLTEGPGPVKQASAAAESASAQASTPKAGEKSGSALAERLRHLRDEAEQLARELEELEKDTVKK
jgi:hypothetical protein